MEAKKHIADLHTEHLEWLSKLVFYKEEIQSFNNRLGEIVKANTIKDVTAQAEHFQNQFIRQNEVIDELRHEIKAHENVLTKQVEANPVASDHRVSEDHSVIRDKVVTFEKIYGELKQEFTKFLSKSL
jgi:Asp-tRNA(Asn)/Glu-tRNA(Gln) amidotransferase C subunit